MGINIKDTEWQRESFAIPSTLKIDIEETRSRSWSSSKYKFSDTSLGGAPYINPPAQYTRYADLKQERVVKSVGHGLGRYYSEQIEDRAQIVHLRFGVGQHNTLRDFFNNAYNRDMGNLARTGRYSNSLMFSLGKIIGWVISLPVKPIIWLHDAAVNGVRFLLNIPATKFYYLRPTMPLYWSTVQTMVNLLAVNMGMIPDMAAYKNDATGNNLADLVQEANRLVPSTWIKDGQVDIYSVATKYQRYANIWRERLEKIRDESSDFTEVARKIRELGEQGIDLDKIGAQTEESGFIKYIQKWLGIADSQRPESQPTSQGGSELGPNFPTQSGQKSNDDPDWIDFFHAERRAGSAWVSFKVDDPGTVSESFSSTTRESDLASTVNGASSQARSMRFNLAEGNSGFAPLDAVVKGVKDFAEGITAGLGIDGVLDAMVGNGIIDIPKYWEGSTAQLPRNDFTIQLRTPYGNALSRFQNLLIPLCYLLAGALPKSTGAESYGSPFLVECYYRGHSQCRLGIIESLNVTRGAGNVGWTSRGEPLGIDITFTVVDLSSIMHMPIGTGDTPTPFNVMDWTKILFAEDSAYNDYMAVLSSLSLTDQTLQSRKLKRNWYRMAADFNTWFSVSHFMNWSMGTMPGELITAFSMAQAKN